MRGLAELARAVGIQTRFRDNAGTAIHASADAIVAALAGMGVEAGTPKAVRRSLGERRALQERPGLEPVVVVRAGGPGCAALRIPGNAEVAACTVTNELGNAREWKAQLEATRANGAAGHGPPIADVHLPPLSVGYHRLNVSIGRDRYEATIIASPGRVAPLPRRQWGLFAPLYALRSRDGSDPGDLADLEAFGRQAGDLGASIVGTLPMLASFLDEPIDPSPYVPVSRSAWNELYAHLDGVSELAADRRPAERYVDFERVARVKRMAFRRAAEQAHATDAWQQVEEYGRRQPQIALYARFRGAAAVHGRDWRRWPDSLRRGLINAGDFDEAEYRYHLYAQWLTAKQLREVSDRLAERDVALYLDFPVGAHPDGFDAWSYQSLFAENCNIGAPPDSFFAGGQDWGFRPMKPEALRGAGYAPLRGALAHHMAVAGLLRIDHVMGFHRLYWVPHGMGATEGVYVRYSAGEIYAVLCVESYRHGVPVIGEDLGTVPRAVRQQMNRHGLGRMFVVQTELHDGEALLARPPRNSIASLNTHDMPTFAGFWTGKHEGTPADAVATPSQRQGLCALANLDTAGTGPAPVAAGIQGWLADSPAAIVLVNPDDLAGELEPHNVPGTSEEHPNWRRKASWIVDDVATGPEFASLRELNRRRKGGRG